MRFRPGALFVHLLLLLGGLIMAFPFYWMLATSLKSPQEALQAKPIWVPERMKPSNWLKAARLGDSPLWGGLAPGRSVELVFPGKEGPPPRALIPRTPGAFFDPRAEGTRVEVVYREGAWRVRL
ncbi:MAG: carbohydrate ABC transporter permease, partial [Thermus sp.]